MNSNESPPIPAEDLARFCDAITAVHDVLAANLEEAAARHGLTTSEARLLSAVDPDEPVAFHQHAARFGLDPSSISLLGRALTDAGLTEIRPDPTDGRRRHLRLTAEGQSVRARILADLADVPLALDRITRAGLRRLATQLEHLDPTRSVRS